MRAPDGPGPRRRTDHSTSSSLHSHTQSAQRHRRFTHQPQTPAAAGARVPPLLPSCRSWSQKNAVGSLLGCMRSGQPPDWCSEPSSHCHREKNLFGQVLARELHGSPRDLHVDRLRTTNIEDIVDEDHLLKSCVLLGFSRVDADVLVSYSSVNDSYFLELWHFRGVGQRVQLACRSELFRAEDGPSSQGVPQTSAPLSLIERPTTAPAAPRTHAAATSKQVTTPPNAPAARRGLGQRAPRRHRGRRRRRQLPCGARPAG